MGTDLGQLRISRCFKGSSFDLLARFHSEVLTSDDMDFAVRKIKSS